MPRRNSETREGSPPKSKIQPASGEHKRAIEADCDMLLSQEIFDVDDFEGFVTSMIHLLGGIKYDDREKWMNSSDESFDARRDPKKFGLTDQREDGTTGYIRLGMFGEKTAHITFKYPGIEQDAAYERKIIDNKEKFAPRIRNAAAIAAPEMNYQSYVTGESRPIFPNNKYLFGDTENVTEQQMQQVCKNVFAIYKKQSRASVK